MNRRQMLMVTLPLVVAPTLLMAQAKNPPPAPVAKTEARRDPYAPTEVAIRSDFEVGSIVVVSKDFFLYHVVAPGRAIRYGVAVGKDELVWKGRATVGRKTEWPSWTPTPAMIKRKPAQYGKWAGGMPGGPSNALGARAMYLFNKGGDTGYRLHGTPEWNSIGKAMSSGCIRMLNQDIIDLHARADIGAKVIVK